MPAAILCTVSASTDGPAHDVPGGRFIVAAQNHGQVGNRARGDRLHHLVSPGRAKIAAALVVTAPFVPLLFQGEEWGASSPFQYFTAHEDELLGAQVSEGRRQEFAAFGWDPAGIPDPQSRETFESSRLQWDELSTSDHADRLHWYRALLRVRQQFPSLRNGKYREATITVDEERRHLFICRDGIEIACNLGDTPTTMNTSGCSRL